MKKFLYVLFAVFISVNIAAAYTNQTDWQEFSKKLEHSLKSENTGIKLSAMQLIIQYGEHLSFSNEAVFNVMKEFRTNENQQIRKLALVTLSKMNNKWAFDYLRRHYKFEENQEVKKLLAAIIYENNNIL